MDKYESYGWTDEYNKHVPIFNSLLNKRNKLYEEYSDLVKEINVKVMLYNSR